MAEAGNTDRLYDEEIELLETAGFDLQVAGAELLGRDVALVCSSPALELARSVLESEQDIEQLITRWSGRQPWPRSSSA